MEGINNYLTDLLSASLWVRLLEKHSRKDDMHKIKTAKFI